VQRRVRGILFVDYVRMVRGEKSVDWTPYLHPEDLAYLAEKIDEKGWYPMETFERLGIAILKVVARGQLEGIRMWGGFQVAAVLKLFPELLAAGEPRESLMRFNVLADSFFDYGALRIVSVVDDHAVVGVAYGMSPVAEEAASTQTLGFFQRLVELAGGCAVDARFASRSWAGDARTLIELNWSVST
jgi:hypothetical protein